MPNKKPPQRRVKKRKIQGGTVVGPGGGASAVGRLAQTIGPVIREHFGQVAPASLAPSVRAARNELVKGKIKKTTTRKKVR